MKDFMDVKTVEGIHRYFTVLSTILSLKKQSVHLVYLSDDLDTNQSLCATVLMRPHDDSSTLAWTKVTRCCAPPCPFFHSPAPNKDGAPPSGYKTKKNDKPVNYCVQIRPPVCAFWYSSTHFITFMLFSHNCPDNPRMLPAAFLPFAPL
jgi:hypothetical protein